MTFGNFNPGACFGLFAGLAAAVWHAPALLAQELWPEITSPVPENAAIETRIDGLLARMSLDEKVGQVIQGEIQNVTPEDVRQYHLGSVLNGGGSFPGKNKLATPADWVGMADAYYHASMDTADGGVAIPVIWGTDAVHGHSNVYGATLFPHNIGLGATGNPGLIRKIGAATAIEVAVTGIAWTFAPTVAVARDDRWGRSYESYSEDPAVVEDYAAQMVLGIQGDPASPDFLGHGRMLATAKHFLADGGTTDGIDQGNAVLSESELVRLHARGYFSALGAGVQTVMASFSSWNGVKMHGNRYLLTEVLKQRLGFDGFVVGDWNGHGQVPTCSNESCAAAFNAGIDMFMAPDGWKGLWHATKRQVQSGEIPMERLDDAVRRIVRVKLRLGLFEKGAPSTWPYAGKSNYLGSKEHRTIARRAVRESLVLLKNEGGLLPLNPASSVLVAGKGADNIGMQSGGWTLSWQGTGNQSSDFPGATSIFDGIRAAVASAGGKATLSEGGEFTDEPDAAIVVFGEEPYAEFNGDRTHLQFNAGDRESLAILRALKAAGVPVVAVFLSGRPMWVNPEINASDAFVAAWLPGSEGAGVADVLFSAADGSVRHEFSGRLPFSWPKSPQQTPLNFDDGNYDPLFAYGAGLSGTEAGHSLDLLDEEGLAVSDDQPLNLFVGTLASTASWFAFSSAAGGSRAPLSLQFYTGASTPAGPDWPVLEQTDRHVQHDAMTIEWMSGEPGVRGVGISTGSQLETMVDHSSYLGANGQLRFDLRLESPLPDTVAVGGFCGSEPSACQGWMELTPLLKQSGTGEWKSYHIDLGCLAKNGMDFSQAAAPFILAANGPIRFELSDVMLVPSPASEASGPCIFVSIATGEHGWEFVR